MSDRTDKFDAQFDKTFNLVNWAFKGFFVFWIISALLGVGLMVGLIWPVYEGIHYLSRH
jgi:hypothetical protein